MNKYSDIDIVRAAVYIVFARLLPTPDAGLARIMENLRQNPFWVITCITIVMKWVSALLMTTKDNDYKSALADEFSNAIGEDRIMTIKDLQSQTSFMSSIANLSLSKTMNYALNLIGWGTSGSASGKTASEAMAIKSFPQLARRDFELLMNDGLSVLEAATSSDSDSSEEIIEDTDELSNLING